MITNTWSAVSEQISGVGVGVALGVGVAVGVGVGVDAGVGVGVPVTVPGSGVGVGDGLVVTSGVAVASGVGVGVDVDGMGVGVGVAPDARSPILRFTSGTSSSKTALSIVTSPEPVTSTETVPISFFKTIETWAFAIVSPPAVFQVRPRQSKAIVSTVLNVTPLGSGMVFVSRTPSPSRSRFTL